MYAFLCETKIIKENEVMNLRARMEYAMWEKGKLGLYKYVLSKMYF